MPKGSSRSDTQEQFLSLTGLATVANLPAAERYRETVVWATPLLQKECRTDERSMSNGAAPRVEMKGRECRTDERPMRNAAQSNVEGWNYFLL